MQHRVLSNIGDPLCELGFVGQIAEEQQVGDFEKAAVFRHSFDGVSAISQNPAIRFWLLIWSLSLKIRHQNH